MKKRREEKSSHDREPTDRKYVRTPKKKDPAHHPPAEKPKHCTLKGSGSGKWGRESYISGDIKENCLALKKQDDHVSEATKRPTKIEKTIGGDKTSA